MVQCVWIYTCRYHKFTRNQTCSVGKTRNVWLWLPAQLYHRLIPIQSLERAPPLCWTPYHHPPPPCLSSDLPTLVDKLVSEVAGPMACPASSAYCDILKEFDAGPLGYLMNLACLPAWRQCSLEKQASQVSNSYLNVLFASYWDSPRLTCYKTWGNRALMEFMAGLVTSYVLHARHTKVGSFGKTHTKTLCMMCFVVIAVVEKWGRN